MAITPEIAKAELARREMQKRKQGIASSGQSVSAQQGVVSPLNEQITSSSPGIFNNFVHSMPVQAAASVGQGLFNTIPDIMNLGVGIHNGGLPEKEIPGVLERWPSVPRLNVVDENISNKIGEILGESLTPGKTIFNIAKKFSPSLKREEILKYLGDGKTISENKEAIANLIKNSGTVKSLFSKKLYSEALDPAKELKIFEYILPKGKEFISSPVNEKYMGNEVSAWIQKFNKNPTVENAHWLQSEAASRGYQLRNQRSLMKKDEGKKLIDFSKQIRTDLEKTLETKDPSLLEKYKNATEYFRKNVDPYKNHPVLSKLLNEDKDVNLNSLVNLFSNKKLSRRIEAVKEHGGEELGKKLIYNKVGTASASGRKLFSPTKTGAFAESLQKSFKEQGLAPYKTVELEKLQKELEKNLMLRNLGTGALGIGASPFISKIEDILFPTRRNA